MEGEFGAEGAPAQNVTYRAKVAAKAPPEVITELMQFTDRVAEVQNTLRAGTGVTLNQVEAESL